MAYEKIASDLAACFYAASLLPDPTLEADPPSAARHAYRRQGRDLVASLIHPERLAKIRCTCGTRTRHPDRPSRVIATVHDKGLLMVKGPRGAVIDGLRLVDHFLIDFGIAHRDGFKSASVWCYGCGALHDLGFGWLKRARLNAVSTPTEQYQLAPWGDPIAPQGYTPRHPNDANRLAFAIVTGGLDSPEPVVTLGWLYAFDYRDQFGFHPPHDQHLFRLVRQGDSRVQDPHVTLLPPQWWTLQHDTELREDQRIHGPLATEELQALAEDLREADTPEREDALLTLEQLMDRPDFDHLAQLLTEEAT